MKHTIKILTIAIVMLVLAVISPSVSADQTSDTFDITVTGEYIWIDITNTSWALGTVSMSTSHWTNQTGKAFLADKTNCTVITDLKLQITSDAADWSAATAGNEPDTDTYRLNASTDVWVAEDLQIVTAAATTIEESIAADADETFDLRFDVPTSTSTGDEQTITVTATLAKH